MTGRTSSVSHRSSTDARNVWATRLRYWRCSGPFMARMSSPMYWPITSLLIALENVSQSRSTSTASAYRVTWNVGRGSNVWPSVRMTGHSDRARAHMA